MSKQFGRHQTVHSTLKREVGIIRALTGVDRVILGPSRGTRHNRPVGSIRVQGSMMTGIRVLGYSDRGVSEFYVITSDVETVRNQLHDRYGAN